MELIKIEQAIKLTDKFDEISSQVDKKIEVAKNLVVSEDNYKDAKKIRAELNKEFKVYADDFKKIKTAVLAPWTSCEDEYKAKIKDKFSQSDSILKSKIDEIENGLKNEKRAEIERFFTEHRDAKNLSFVSFDDMNLKIGMSNSLKSLKNEVIEKLESISTDYNAALEISPEVVAEFKNNNFILSQAISTVNDRIERQKKAEEERQKAIERKKELEEKEAEIKAKALESEPEIIEIKEEAEENPKIITVTFSVSETKEKLIELSKFLRSNNYNFEQK